MIWSAPVGASPRGKGPRKVVMSKSSDKPRKGVKQKPQRTLKERRSEKRAAKKYGSSSLLQDK